jgi:hypothetical protein
LVKKTSEIDTPEKAYVAAPTHAAPADRPSARAARRKPMPESAQWSTG